MDQRLMPDILDIREIVFTNLLLLDFKPDVFEAKHHCPFNRDAFVFPNKKAMEEVFYFLFMKLNPSVAKEEFWHCWPIHDKKQESTFRKVSVQWLNRLNKEVHGSNIPRVVASVLLSPGGDKFYHLLFCFSSFVLKEELRKVLYKDEVILPWPNTSSSAKSFPHQTSKLLTARVILETERFLRSAELSTKAQDKWVQFASELTKDNRAIRKKKREIEKELKNLESEHLKRGLLSPASSRSSSHQNSPYSGQIKSLKRTKILQRVRGYWKRISEMYEFHRILREKIDQIIHGSANKYVLRAGDINIKIPDLLLRECEEEIYQKRISNTFESGCVNLLSLVQLLNLSLHLILEQLRSHQLPFVTEEEADVRDKLHVQSAYLQTTQSLKEIVEKEMIPELSESINELQEMVEFSNSIKHFTPKANRKIDFSLTGLPMTPSVHLNSEADSDHQKEPIAFSRELFTNDNVVVTPDAVEKLVKSLRDSSIDSSPIDNIGKKETMEKPPQGSSTKKHTIPKQLLKSKVPVPKAKSATKQKLQKGSLINQSVKTTGSQEIISMRKDAKKKQHHAVESIAFDDTQIYNQKGKIHKDGKMNQSKGEKIAHDILADKIAFSVLTKDDIVYSTSSSSSASSSRCPTPMEHGLEDPISAMSKDAFTARDKIQRTPLKKDNQATRRRTSHDALQSYLGQMLPFENSFVGEPAHGLESFTEAPKDSLFDSSLFSHTPKHTMLSHAEPDENSKKSDRRMRFGVDAFDLEAHVFESPQFDEEVQTPLVNWVIESSVRKSVLKPKDLYDSFNDEDSPNGRNGNVDKGSKGGARMPMSPFEMEANSAFQDSSSSQYLNGDKVALPDKVAVTNNVAGHDVIAASQRGDVPHKVTEHVLNENGAEIPNGQNEKVVRKEMESSMNDDLAQIIERYKNLKMKSQKIVKTNIGDHQDDEYGKKMMQTDERSEPVNDSTLFEKENIKDIVDENGVTTSIFSFEINGTTPLQKDHSIFETARNSAKKDVANWSNLKGQITSYDENDQVLHSKYDSFEDLEIPVAKQLSFLQIDTRDISHVLRHENHPSAARKQNSPKRIEEIKDNGHLSGLFGYDTPENISNQNKLDLLALTYEGSQGLSYKSQREASPFHFFSNRKDDKNDIEPKSDVRERGSRKTELSFEFGDSKEPLKNNSTDSVNPPVTKKHLNASDDVTMGSSIFETPQLKTLDSSFNVLTPGLELQKGVEMFAMDGGSPVLERDYHGMEKEYLDQDVNLIDF